MKPVSVPPVSRNPVRTDHKHHCDNDSQSPDVAVVASYAKRQQTYHLTPACKYAGKAVAHESMRKLANECLKDGRHAIYILVELLDQKLKLLATSSPFYVHVA